MKRFTRSTLFALVIAAPIPVLAQNDATGGEAPRAPEGMDGMDSMNGMPDGGMMPMMNMMMQCASMMESMHGNGTMPEGMGSGSMTQGMMGQGESAQYDAAAAEALARAYLSGRAPESAQDIEFLGTSLDAGRYTITYRQGSTEGVVMIDATTGAIVPEDQP